MNNNMIRTISELWKTLPENQQKQIAAEVMVVGGVSYPTVYTWISGRRRPKFLYRQLLKNAIRKYAGVNVPIAELFPPKSGEES